MREKVENSIQISKANLKTNKRNRTLAEAN